jgi:hypothetical protein
VFSQSVLVGQTIPVGSIPEEILRSMQLMNKMDSSISFTVRPLGNQYTQQAFEFMGKGTNENIYKPPTYFSGTRGRFTLLPITFIQQYNTHHPYGWNDGAMIAAKGYQTLLSAGVYAAFGPLEIQLQPEFVYASNLDYEHNIAYGSSGTSYQKIFPGQSRISLSAGAVSVGLSTENLWWGPGKSSSLLMSNNAPGFLHGFLSSNKSIKTGIGNFEWQIIGAKLTSDDNWAYENYNLVKSITPITSWRYLSAYVVSYHPKWTPGFFLGMTRGLQRYREDITLSGTSFLNQYIPVLTKPFQKKNALGDDTLRTDQLASFFLRWVLPKVQMEFYIEYGFNDYGVSVRDYVMAPTHSAAYIVGAKKIVSLQKPFTRLELGVELTQMSQSPDYLVREAGNWYVHSAILQGYTHNNQIIGAGAGLGANVQNLSATWISGWKQFGVFFERVERDPLYHSNDWIDLSIGVMPQLKYGNIILSGKFQFINSNQYAWEKDVNKFNMFSRLCIYYLF